MKDGGVKHDCRADDAKANSRDELQRGLAAYSLRHARALYDLSEGNPVFAWRAYRAARNAGVDVPAWVLEYLDDAARRIVALEPGGKKVRDQFAEAIGATAKHKILDDAAKWDKWLTAYQRFQIYTKDDRIGITEGEAYDRIQDELGEQREGAGHRTVKRWIDAIEDALQRTPE